MTIAERLRAIVSVMPPESMVSLPVATLREWLEDAPAGEPEDRGRLSDLTCEELAADFGCSADTVRRWCRMGRLDAYRGTAGEFRIPRAAVQRFVEAQRRGKNNEAPQPAADLGSWKKIRKAG